MTVRYRISRDYSERKLDFFSATIDFGGERIHYRTGKDMKTVVNSLRKASSDTRRAFLSMVEPFGIHIPVHRDNENTDMQKIRQKFSYAGNAASDVDFKGRISKYNPARIRERDGIYFMKLKVEDEDEENHYEVEEESQEENSETEGEDEKDRKDEQDL